MVMSFHRVVPFLFVTALTAACGGEIATVLTDKDSDDLSAGSSGGRGASSGSATEPGSSSSSSSGEVGGSSGSSSPFVECAGEPTRWDPSTLPAGMTLSADGLVVERTAGGAFEGAALGTVQHQLGKYYFEVQFLGTGNERSSVGVAGTVGAAKSRCSVSSAGNLSCSFTGADGQSGGGSGGGTPVGSFAPGDVVGVAADLDEQRIYFTVNGAPLGDVSILFLSSEPRLPLRPTAELANGDSFRGSFGTFQYGPPAGYGAWDCTP